MKKNTFRLTVIALLAAACAPMFLTSCSKDVNTRTATFIITNDMWDYRDGDWYCDFAWSALDKDALSVGTINAYLLLTSQGTEYQNPLPYVYYTGLVYYDTLFFDQNNPAAVNGMWVNQSVNIRYDVSYGRITFVFSDLAHYATDRTEMPTMRFRAVVTYPVEY